MYQEKAGEESGIDLTQGYCIKVHVLPDGFKVSEPEPIEEYDQDESADVMSEAGDDAESELIPDLATMLKNVMAVVQGHPVGESEQSAFEKSASS